MGWVPPTNPDNYRSKIRCRNISVPSDAVLFGHATALCTRVVSCDSMDIWLLNDVCVCLGTRQCHTLPLPTLYDFPLP